MLLVDIRYNKNGKWHKDFSMLDLDLLIKDLKDGKYSEIKIKNIEESEELPF